MEGMRSSRDEHRGAEWRPPTGRRQTEDGCAMLAAVAASGQGSECIRAAKGLDVHGRSAAWRRHRVACRPDGLRIRAILPQQGV